MVATIWKKSPDILVMPRFGAEGVTLRHAKNAKVVHLNSQQEKLWITWSEKDISNSMGSCFNELLSGGFLSPISSTETASHTTQTPFDKIRPNILKGMMRWYQETPDLTVLFNSERMSQNNPLLTLSPYGSLVWNGIIQGLSVFQMRQEALRVFGCDEVISFLKRLSELGMISMENHESLPLLGNERMRKEFLAPNVQQNLFHTRVPWYCLWEINTACDLRCKVCYLPHFSSKGPSLEQTQNIIQQLIEAGVFYVCILGGESLLRKDLETIISKLRSAGIFVKIITNGQSLSKERIKSLSVVDLNLIEVSFDGLKEATHDESRGNGSFKKAIEAVE